MSGLLVVLHDITRERKLSQLQQEFVANVSHELRTPLTTIKSYVEALVDNPMDDMSLQHRFLRVVENETDRMVRLVQDLLILSRLDYQQVRWNKEWVDVKKLAEETFEQVAVELEEARLYWSIQIPHDLPALFLDRDRIKQVLLNLLSNARQYTPPEGLITLRAVVEEGDVTVSIEDTGSGIPPEDLTRVFERFYRVDKTRSRDHGGTGLGLSIARQIIEAHGGRMQVESSVGQGTRVSFTLPLAQDLEEGDSLHVGEI